MNAILTKLLFKKTQNPQDPARLLLPLSRPFTWCLSQTRCGPSVSCGPSTCSPVGASLSAQGEHRADAREPPAHQGKRESPPPRDVQILPESSPPRAPRLPPSPWAPPRGGPPPPSTQPAKPLPHPGKDASGFQRTSVLRGNLSHTPAACAPGVSLTCFPGIGRAPHD